MIRSSYRVLSTALGAVLLFGNVASAQEFFRASRFFHGLTTTIASQTQDPVPTGLFGVASVQSGSATAKWDYRDPVTATQSRVTASVPISWIGDGFPLGDEHFLLSGLYIDPLNGSRVGRLVIVRCAVGSTGPSLLVQSTQDLIALDPVKVCYNSNDDHIYIWELDSKAVLAASWSGLGAALPNAGQFSVVVTRTQQPELLRHFNETAFMSSELFHAAGSVGSPHLKPVTAGCTLYDQWTRGLTQLHPGGLSGWAIRQTSTDYYASPPRHFVIPEGHLVGGSESFELRYSGSGTIQYEIWDNQATELVSGAVSSGGVILGPFAEFNASPGRFYEVRDPQGV